MKIIGIILAVIIGIIALAVAYILLKSLWYTLKEYYYKHRRFREIRCNARRVKKSLSSASERTERLTDILSSMERSEREEYLANMAKNANWQNPEFYESSGWLWRMLDNNGCRLVKEAERLGRRYPIEIIGHLDARNLGPVLEVPSNIDIAGISLPVTDIRNYTPSCYQFAGMEDPCSGIKLSNLPEVENLILPESLIGYLVLDSLPKLRSLRLPELLKGCSVHDCSKLESLKICNQDFDFESLYLTGCPELREVTIPYFESLHKVAPELAELSDDEIEDDYKALWVFYNMLVYGKNVESGMPSVVRFADGYDGSRLILPSDPKEATAIMRLYVDIYGNDILKRLVFPKDFPFWEGDQNLNWPDLIYQMEYFYGLEVLELPECIENFGQYHIITHNGNIATHSYFREKEEIDVEGTVVNAWEFLRELKSLKEIWVSAECDVTGLPLPAGCTVKRYLTKEL